MKITGLHAWPFSCRFGGPLLCDDPAQVKCPVAFGSLPFNRDVINVLNWLPIMQLLQFEVSLKYTRGVLVAKTIKFAEF